MKGSGMKGKRARFFHWSNAETSFFSQAVNKFGASLLEFLYDVDFIDMHKIFVSEPIVIKSCLNFRLKDIVKAMYKNGLIKSSYEESVINPSGIGSDPSEIGSASRINDGMIAMFTAIKYFKCRTKESKSCVNEDLKSIIDYNKLDCQVLWEILNYLRTYHT